MVVYHGQDKLAEPSARGRLILHVGWGEVCLRRVLSNLFDVFSGNAVPGLERTLKISYVVVRVGHLFLNIGPRRLNTFLDDGDSREDILDALWWVGQCLNLLNIFLTDIIHGDVQPLFRFNACFIIIIRIRSWNLCLRSLSLSGSLGLPSTLDYSGGSGGCSDCSCLITSWT